MKTTDLRFRIAQTQRDQQTALMNAILITVFAVVTASVGPQFLYQYALQNAALEQQMLILGNLPVVSYGIALIVFAVAFDPQLFPRTHYPHVRTRTTALVLHFDG
ncbi:hypothetical protein LRY58_02255 [Candidatus Woesebacteria bacterium]|nr:hypothetical protein [Candidatus Woesebacteria bacterium]